MYHITNRRNVESILEKGLVRDTFFAPAPCYVWLFRERAEADALMDAPWGGSRGGNALFEVDVEGVEVLPDPHPGWGDVDTWVVTVDLEPERVKLLAVTER